MTRISPITLAAALALGAAASATAQSPGPAQGQNNAPAMTAPAAPATTAPVQGASTATQTPIVVETKVDLRSGAPQSPESADDARKEARGALAEARAACRQEGSREARNDCMRQAQEDANALMNGAHSR